MNTRRKAKKSSENQKEKLVQFMGNNLSFARNQIPAMAELTKLWDKLVRILNSMNGTKKTRKQWQRTWTDWKALVKNKALRINNSRNQTEDSEDYDEILTPLEEKVLEIIGSISVDAKEPSLLPPEPEFVDVPMFIDTDTHDLPSEPTKKRKHLEDESLKDNPPQKKLQNVYRIELLPTVKTGDNPPQKKSQSDYMEFLLTEERTANLLRKQRNELLEKQNKFLEKQTNALEKIVDFIAQ